MRDVEEIVEHWREEPPVGKMLREYFGVQSVPLEPVAAPVGPREVTEEEFRRIAAAEEGFAEKHGRQLNPFL